ncbi:DEAD/DEAH box helicase family protein [Luteimonas sp. RD2P54]|uniref:DEAD/DEAH box helicase family protein n=1 Tax=Luteimonas endophytica TaxID=3042023 RepID=A0ABT6JBN2_9GAMM|nr:DEAD/DEAH box helicase family protein [Luteimonas endophytica]MDH5824211.1 DEAD/DEAH box helicase family protein [Luteimonas endophytica]
MKLKDYQKGAIKSLRTYLERTQEEGPSLAFNRVADHAADYRPILDDQERPVPSLESVPYVCLRIPTGGGKTILGAHIIKTVAEAWLAREYPLVLWLVPTKQIKNQTLEAFSNPRHPYRQELDDKFGVGKVQIFDIADNGMIRPQDIADNLCLIIGTMASARVADTEIRDFYADKEDLEPHFIKLPTIEGLEQKEGKNRAKFSFANLLRIHRPLVITDEAHNANTALSYQVYERLSPSAIIELTATPEMDSSNVLVSVSASVLKAEQMIKLPVVLKEHIDGWEECLQSSLQRRTYLETLAPGEAPDYLRPILLIQAENKDKIATVEVVHKHLVDNEKVSEDQIVVATGDQRGLDDVDLFDPDCPVRIIITKDALKEGWDCSFAYVLCSLTQQRSGTAIMQLLGRVLRMPYARERNDPELNRAYAHVVSPSFGVAAQELTDDLEAMGFNPVEAAGGIVRELPLKGGTTALEPQKLTLELPKAPNLTTIPAGDRGKVEVQPKAGTDKFVITIVGQIDTATQDAIVETLPKRQQHEAKKRLVHHNVRASALRETPAQRQEKFRVPRLMFKQGTLVLEASADILLDHSGWSILNHPADLSSFRYVDQSRTFLVDVDEEEVKWERDPDAQERFALGMAAEWTDKELVAFLDRRVRQPDILQPQLVEWIRRAVQGLFDRGFDLAQLVRAKFVIARKLAEQIKKARTAASEKNYQTTLFATDAPVLADFDHAYTFDPNAYPSSKPCVANYKWKKHYYAVPGDLPHKRASGQLAEEFLCALALDNIEEIDFWVRNIKHHSQFRLPTATGWTYPDFVARLKDGRLLVVEYKGGDRVSNDDSKSKAQMGHLWQGASDGQGIYLMAVAQDEAGRSVEEQIRDAIAGKVGGKPA